MSFYCVDLPYQSNAAIYYAALADLPWAVWLDSGGMARYDILTANPQHTLVLDDSIVQNDPFALLRDALGERSTPLTNIPFAGGALGYWSYDLARRMVTLPEIARDSAQLPDMAIGIYDWAVVVDHQQRSARLVSHLRFAETAELLPQLLLRLQRSAQIPADSFRVDGKIVFNFTPQSYALAYAQVQNYLREGDCYQVNLAQCFSAQAQGDAFGAYLRLREQSPAPYAAFLNLPQIQILCNSPERFISVQSGKVETRPIKGTRPRSADKQRDAQLAEELRHHPKDRAENLMIVDLLRSDLAKNCQPGSVLTPALFEVESFANVHHLVSTVEGKLAVGRDALDVLRGCFPGGSVTGAPKLRAMQIIEQLEPDRRSVYCGAIGYVGFDGNMDSNIAIRTLVYASDSGATYAQSANEVSDNLAVPTATRTASARSGVIRGWVGGGIVADSEERAEYQETLDKATAMLKLLQHYGGEL